MKDKCKGPYCIGLTGNIATGKSTVAGMLVALGAFHIDADRVAHEVIAPGGEAYAGVVKAFGPQIVAPDGSIDRQRLGDIVFNDPEALARLESRVHPAVIREVERQIEAATTPAVVVEAIKLLESGMAERYDTLWVTACSPQIQLERLMEQRGLTYEDAQCRIQAQPSQSVKIARADVVIETGGTLDETRQQVLVAWKAIVPLL